jgi:xylulokinase
MTYLPLENKTPYLDAYQIWKNELEILIKNKL